MLTPPILPRRPICKYFYLSRVASPQWPQTNVDRERRMGCSACKISLLPSTLLNAIQRLHFFLRITSSADCHSCAPFLFPRTVAWFADPSIVVCSSFIGALRAGSWNQRKNSFFRATISCSKSWANQGIGRVFHSGDTKEKWSFCAS